ncbi:chromosome segregation protein SMC [Allisonella histaminiformans]|uniref:chromosome segregation protein SMC n=1 Tax=Allisonella histaminiformans TaxID=209880 RepID=UPI0022E16FA2|nr:chromosome segregation protein SMC [Allisonella histaminiformans]
MKLIRLILQGFKSFADRTTIDFAEGMTVIVGPNGCGKSNISDAVRWVLGEQNVRNIRGQKAEDIIFSGSEKRKAKNAAMVSLILDNSGHELPLDTAEVSITRKIFRNGDSEFYINKRSCRLKDIQELLANTGIGKGSMVIIGQNQVDRILSARPEERRVIFEEVAGISKYRMKKVDGLRKLEKASANTERVLDLKAVMEEQSEPLRVEAEKARKYCALQKEKKTGAVTAALLKLSAARRMMARYENDQIRLEEKKQEAMARLEEVGRLQKQLENEMGGHQKALSAASGELADKKAQAEQLRGDCRVQEENLKHASEELNRLTEQREDEQQARLECREDHEACREELEAVQAELQSGREHLETIKQQKEILEEKLLASKAEYARQLQATQESIAQHERLVQEKNHREEDKDRLAGEAQAHELRWKVLEEECSKLKEEKAELTRKHLELEAKLSQLTEKGKEDAAARDKAENIRYEMLRRLNERQAEEKQVQLRRKDLEKQMEEHVNFSHTTRTVLQASEAWSQHIIGPLGELIRVPEKYTAAAEIALGSMISNLVVDTSETAQTIISWLKNRHAGRTTFYPLDSMSGYPVREILQAAREPGICGIAASLFEHDEKISGIMQSILGRILIAEDMDAARRTAKKYRYRFRIVTLDGQVVNAGGSMTGGSMRKKDNTYFGRKSEIKKLAAKEKALHEEIGQQRAAKEKQDALCESLLAAITREREEWQNRSIEAASMKTRLEGMEKELAGKEETAQMEKNSLEMARSQWEQADQACRQLCEQLEHAQKPGKQPEKDEKSAQLQDKVNALNEQITDARVQLTRAESNVAQKQEEINKLVEADEESGRTLERLQEAIEKKKQVVLDINVRLKAQKKQCEEADQHWKVMEQKRQILEQQAGDFSRRRIALDEDWKKVQAQYAEADSRMSGLDARLESFRNDESRELDTLTSMGLTEKTAESFRIKGSGEDIKKMLASVEKRIAELGNVNPQGEAEYEEHMEKLAFYDKQLDDLRKSEEGLQKIVHEIDDAMTAQFKQAFAKINVEFGRIMKVMFRGGKGHLDLTDKVNPLNGGIELYLQLPGKKTQSLTLMSGGERALTVCALLLSFMAYSPAPFCFLDEIDAALDDANVERYGRMIEDYKKKTQFIIISHRKKTMEFADTLQGVTMAEKGVSSLITVRVSDYIKEE